MPSVCFSIFVSEDIRERVRAKEAPSIPNGLCFRSHQCIHLPSQSFVSNIKHLQPVALAQKDPHRPLLAPAAFQTLSILSVTYSYVRAQIRCSLLRRHRPKPETDGTSGCLPPAFLVSSFSTAVISLILVLSEGKLVLSPVALLFSRLRVQRKKVILRKSKLAAPSQANGIIGSFTAALTVLNYSDACIYGHSSRTIMKEAIQSVIKKIGIRMIRHKL
ncbi:hypothetical protein DER44DRAFT_84814 [Fusarium oxysporum]|nr:hypothetical protein DER44DRAFT_84814 [Fusarium oxysporum]